MTWPVQEMELPGRGKALVATRDIAAGETVLSDSPLLLFVHPAFASSSCAQCLRALDGAGSAPCACGSRVCSAACAEASQAPGCAHTPELCAALQRAVTTEPEARTASSRPVGLVSYTNRRCTSFASSCSCIP